MSSFLGRSGVCSTCQTFDDLWEPSAECDRCRTNRVVREAYARHPHEAQAIYGAATVAEALRRLDIRPQGE